MYKYISSVCFSFSNPLSEGFMQKTESLLKNVPHIVYVFAKIIMWLLVVLVAALSLFWEYPIIGNSTVTGILLSGTIMLVGSYFLSKKTPYITLVSLLGSIIAAIIASLGTYVTPEDTLLRTADNGETVVITHITESLYPPWAKGDFYVIKDVRGQWQEQTKVLKNEELIPIIVSINYEWSKEIILSDFNKNIMRNYTWSSSNDSPIMLIILRQIADSTESIDNIRINTLDACAELQKMEGLEGCPQITVSITREK